MTQKLFSLFRWPGSCSHLFHCFPSQQKDLFSKIFNVYIYIYIYIYIYYYINLFEHFIVQLPLAFKHGNLPSIPRIQARMQWFLCPLLENSLQRFEHGEIW